MWKFQVVLSPEHTKCLQKVSVYGYMGVSEYHYHACLPELIKLHVTRAIKAIIS